MAGLGFALFTIFIVNAAKIVMSTGIIIQARMGSTRLPGKVLLPLGKKTILEHVVERMKTVSNADKVVVATTTSPLDDEIVQLCQKKKYLVSRGSENDVLGRYLSAAEEHGIDVIVRITSDCPLIDPGIVSLLIQLYSCGNYDVAANILERAYPRGLDAELFTKEAGKRVHEIEGIDSFYLEHVTPYFYENPDIFKLVSLKASGMFARPDIRICIDTPDDYLLLKLILEHYPKAENSDYRIEPVLRLFEKYPEWIAINRDVQHFKQGGKT